MSIEHHVALLVVEDGQELDLGHGLGVDQPPEVGDHPHGRGLEYLILCPQNGGQIDISTILIGLQRHVIVEHEIVPEACGHQELTPDADHHKDRLLVFVPDVRKTTSLATTNHWNVINDMMVLECGATTALAETDSILLLYMTIPSDLIPLLRCL